MERSSLCGSSVIFNEAVFTVSCSFWFYKKLNEFKNALGFLTDVQIETLALYSFGASHNQISEVLNIAVGTSKNRVNRILAALPIRTREEVFYFYSPVEWPFHSVRLLQN